MADEFSKGDRVEWHASHGIVRGTVERKLTSETQIEGHTVKASPENPEYLVRSERTGAAAAHKPGALKRAH